MRLEKDKPLYVVIFTFVVSASFVLLLALANEATKDRVAANRLFAEHSAVLRVFGIPYKDAVEVEELYLARIATLPPEEKGAAPAYAATVDGTAYIAVVQAGPGLWGTITAIVSSDAAVARLRGLEILSQNETPGLGGRVDEAWFKAQFKGELVGTLGVTVNPAGPGDADHENARVDAITGASRTSQGIQAILDASLGRLRKIGGGRR